MTTDASANFRDIKQGDRVLVHPNDGTEPYLITVEDVKPADDGIGFTLTISAETQETAPQPEG